MMCPSYYCLPESIHSSVLPDMKNVCVVFINVPLDVLSQSVAYNYKICYRPPPNSSTIFRRKKPQVKYVFLGSFLSGPFFNPCFKVTSYYPSSTVDCILRQPLYVHLYSVHKQCNIDFVFNHPLGRRTLSRLATIEV